MAINSTVKATLTALGRLMTAADDPWWIITGTAVALHGIDPDHVADVDVLLSVGDAKRILPSIGIEPRPGAKHRNFRSDVFGTWFAMPLPVEFMAGFSYRSKQGWTPVWPMTREPVEVDGVTVFVPGRAELCRMLESFGRPRDLARARHLAELTVGVPTTPS